VVIVGFFLESLHVRLLICHIIRRRKRVIDVVFVDGRVPSKSMNRPNVIYNIHPQPRDKQTHLRLVSWSKVHANSAPGMPRAWTLDGDVDEHVRYQSIFVEAAWWEPAIWLNLFSKQELSFGKYWDARLLGEPKLFGMLLRMETLATTFSSLRPNGYHMCD
ncbi:hypothetical protein JG687_00010379, partial [Phytophthora cactorum]